MLEPADHDRPPTLAYQADFNGVPTREQRTVASFVGMIVGFFVTIFCAGTWMMSNVYFFGGPPSARQPFSCKEPTGWTVIGLAAVFGAWKLKKAARRDFRIGLLVGIGLAMLLSVPAILMY